MKKLVFLLFFPIFVFAQLPERQQKQTTRIFGTYGQSSIPQYRAESQRRPSIGEYEQKQIERNRRSDYYTPPNNRPGRYFGYDPWMDWGWGWNRWSPMWGWNTYTPFWWYDNWGYRNPGRVYIYDNGVRDTIKIKPLHGSFGLSYNMNNEYGVWMTLGRSVYFIGEYSRTNNRDISVYYPLLTLDKVLPWQDRKLADNLSSSTFSFGAGKKLNKLVGVHGMVGIGTEESRYRYFDDMYILSNNGEYTIPNYRKTVTSLKVGTILSLSNSFSGKLDYTLGRGEISFGLGLKF